MRTVTTAALALALVAPALAAPPKKLRVDRPEKAGGARVTHVRILSGTVRHRTIAIVLTDTRCTPDAKGVSHCLNRMRVSSGKVILVRHDHRMMDMPCLSPGERVILRPA